MASELLTNFLGPKCFDTLLVQWNVFDSNCLSLLVSKGLSLGVMAGALGVKVRDE
jgi:hypothetical protein